MATLIKAADVRYAAPARPDESPESHGGENADAIELETLRAHVARLQEAMAGHEQEAQRRADAAHETGFAAGEAAERVHAIAVTNARDTALRAGIDAAIAQFSSRLQALEGLCVSIALAALQRVTHDPSARAALVGETVRHHLAQLTAASVLTVVVSRDDFADEAERLGLLQMTQANGIALNVSPMLKSGECQFDLSLGQVDASLDVQVARIRTALLEAEA